MSCRSRLIQPLCRLQRWELIGLTFVLHIYAVLFNGKCSDRPKRVKIDIEMYVVFIRVVIFPSHSQCADLPLNIPLGLSSLLHFSLPSHSSLPPHFLLSHSFLPPPLKEEISHLPLPAVWWMTQWGAPLLTKSIQRWPWSCCFWDKRWEVRKSAGPHTKLEST